MYIIVEVQVFADGKKSTPCYAYDDRNAAEAKYHAILSAAAVSKLPIHSAFMLTVDGRVIRSESYKHEVESEVEE